MSLNIGDIIDDKYRIVRLLGEGGMGAVYEGENVRIRRRVAIKVLHAEIAQTEEAIARFEREAQAAGRIGSEHIVEVLDLGALQNGDRYMVMEFMAGDSLSARIRARGRLDASEIAAIASQLLEALEAAHEVGIIHRDLKPDNVYLLASRSGRTDFVKLLDFGISKFSHSGPDGAFSLTRTGAVMGTPFYMAPEQAKGARKLDHRVDIYATGVILYEAVSGEVPFNAETFNELLFKIVLEEARPVEHLVPGLDAAFAAIVRRAMARDPEQRFQSAAEFRSALEQWAGGSYRPSNPGPSPSGARGRPSLPSNVSLPLGQGTAGNWTRGDDVAPRFKSRTPLLLALGLLGIVVVGGGALAVVNGRAQSAARAATAATAQAQAEEQAARAKAEAEREAERKTAEDQARVAAEIDRERARLAEAELASTPPAPPPAERPAVKTAPAKRKSSANPAPPKEPAADAPPAAPVPAAPTSTGRKIRTSL